jgi:hypothetical protein
MNSEPEQTKGLGELEGGNECYFSIYILSLLKIYFIHTVRIKLAHSSGTVNRYYVK